MKLITDALVRPLSYDFRDGKNVVGYFERSPDLTLFRVFHASLWKKLILKKGQ